MSHSMLFIGTYANAGGGGIYPLRRQRGRWALGEPFAGAPNVSYGAFSLRRRAHYLLNEQREGNLGIFRYERRAWQPLARVPTGGREPCYAALSPCENWLAVANYGSGSVALFRLDEDGVAGDPAAICNNTGRGPDAERQEGPHAHCAVFSPDGRWVYHTDLGADEIRAIAFDADRGLIGEPVTAFRADPGSGPRHLVFHPTEPIALLVCELASTLSVLEVGDGKLSARETFSTLPSGFEGESLGGHLGLNAARDRVYVTNRGHDSIATFALEDGTLRLIDHTPAGGASPRFFLLLDLQCTLLVANEEGNNVVVFDVDADGTLTQCDEVAVAAPAFIFAGQEMER